MDAGDAEVNVGSRRRKAYWRNGFNNPAGLKGLPQHKWEVLQHNDCSAVAKAPFEWPIEVSGLEIICIFLCLAPKVTGAQTDY